MEVLKTFKKKRKILTNLSKFNKVKIIRFFDNQESNLQNFDELKIELNNSKNESQKTFNSWTTYLIMLVLILFLLGIFIWRKE